MELFDTHCHIHEANSNVLDDPVRDKWLTAGKDNAQDMVDTATAQDVTRLICVGTSLTDSQAAITFVQSQPKAWASIGIHPHEAPDYVTKPAQLAAFASLVTSPKVVAIGECGLDYFYNHAPKEQQIELLQFQIELAVENDLPLIFHVRDAFTDFWPIFDSYSGIRGVIHSFTATEDELQDILARNLYVGLNGIMTFTKKPEQLAAARAIPLKKLVLESDAPFLTPTPYRGKINEPMYVRDTAMFLAHLRSESLNELGTVTTQNAVTLFGIEKEAIL